MGKESYFSNKKSRKEQIGIDESNDKKTNSLLLATPTRATPSRKKGTPGSKLFKRLLRRTPNDRNKNIDLASSTEAEGSPVLETVSTRDTDPGSFIPEPPRVARRVDMVGVNSSAVKRSVSMLPDPPEISPLPEAPSKNRGPSVNGHGPLVDMPVPTNVTASYSDSPPSPANLHKTPIATMQPRGIAIPTPAIHKGLENDPRAVLFPHPLPTASPRGDVVSQMNLSRGVSESVDELDDAAFLPDDYLNQGQQKTFTWEQVQTYVLEAEKKLRSRLEDKHQSDMDEFQEEADKALLDHGKQWKSDADAEYKRMDTLLREEKKKTEEKHLDLVLKTAKICELEVELNEAQHERAAYLEKVDALEAQINQSGGATVQTTVKATTNELERHQEELRHLQASKDEANHQVLTLQGQVEELRQQVLSSNVEAEGYQNAQKELEAAQVEIKALKQKLDVTPDVSQEELQRLKQSALYGEDLEKQVEYLKDRLRKQKSAFESEKANLNAGLSVAEIEELTAEVNLLKKQHQEEIEKERESSQRALDNAMIEEEERKKNLLASVEAEKQEMQRRYEAEKEELRSVIKKEILQNGQEEDIKEMQSKFEEDINSVKAKAQSDIEVVQKALNATQSEAEELSIKTAGLESQLREVERKHKAELIRTRNEVQEAMEKELLSLEDTIRSMETGDSALSQKVRQLQAKMEKDRENYIRQIREVRADHDKEMEEVLQQLDLVEAENNERYKKKEKMVEEKDAVISALGSQLAEAQSRLGATAESQEAMSKDLESLREQLEEAKLAITVRDQEREKILSECKKSVEQEGQVRDKMIEEAREEMIQRAEIQFEERNAMYKNLKHEFDGAKAKVTGLERELRSSRKEIEETRKLHEAKEADLVDELAQAKAGTSSIEF